VVFRRRGRVGTRFKRFGRRFLDVFDLLHVGCGPKAAGPLPTIVNLGPITDHPPAALRDFAPNAADPDKVVALVVPLPVAGDPLDIVALGPLIGRELFDGLGRFLFDDYARLGV
jgi:hypothetical protein